MSRTFRELAYERQHSAPQARNGYETLLEQVRAEISKDHAETLAYSITEKDAAEAVKGAVCAALHVRRQLHRGGYPAAYPPAADAGTTTEARTDCGQARKGARGFQAIPRHVEGTACAILLLSIQAPRGAAPADRSGAFFIA